MIDENFKHTREYVNTKFKHLSDIEREKIFQLFRQKGIFPYDYVTSYNIMNETHLPCKDKFYSKLKQEGISYKEYYRAKLVWRLTGCKTFGDYCDNYMEIDVYLLADCLENYRNIIYDKNEIDAFHSYSAPGLSWQIGLKQCGEAFEKEHPGEEFSLELLTDYDMLLMIESGIRGGFSGTLGKRYAKANNKYLHDYDPKIPSSYLQYLDANNLYGDGMKQKLPYSDFKWMTTNEYMDLFERKNNGDPEAIDYFKTHGRIYKVDLTYTDECKLKTWKFPLAPEKKSILPEDLNEWQKKFLSTDADGKPKASKIKKLIVDLKDKKEYVVHERNLMFYTDMGMKVTKVHSIISFREEAWLEPYIDYNTKLRTESKTDFEKNIWKLMNNAFYGKTCENIRNRVDVKFVSSKDQATKLQTNPFYKRGTIFIEDKLIAIQLGIKKVKFDKPIYTGFAILELSKLHMYKSFYEVILVKWPDAIIIGFDTDSFFLYIPTDDLYKDLLDMKDIFDTSDYPNIPTLEANVKRKI